MKPSVRRPLVGLLSTLSLGALAAACGLSFDIVSIPDPVASPDAEIAPVDARVVDTSAPDVVTSDVSVPDASTPDADASTADAAPDATVDAGGCTTILKEDFAVGPGTKLALIGDQNLTKVVGQKLQLLPDDVTATQKAGAAFFTATTDLSDFNATFVLSTGNLANLNETADGFAFSWLEKAVPSGLTVTSLRGGNEMGMILAPAPQQRGFATVLDIYPDIGQPQNRLFFFNEVLPTNPRGPAGAAFSTQDIGGSITLRYKLSRRGNKYTVDIDRGTGMSGAGAPISKTMTLGSANAPARTFVFSSASGGAHSPGFFVDDIEIQRCP